MGHSSDVIEQVKQWYKSHNLDHEKNSFDGGDRFLFSLLRGSAKILIWVDVADDDEQPCFKVISPLVKVPEDKKTLELFEFCMVTNSIIQSFSLAYFENKSEITLIHDRPCEGLDGSEMDFIIKDLGYIADKLDNILVDKYGCISETVEAQKTEGARS